MQEPLTDEGLAEFATYIEENRELYRVPGTAVVVVQGGEVVFAQGFGVKEAGGTDPVTPDTLFTIGSLTKAMTSMMTTTLVDEELVSWDTPVVEVMPQLQLSDADAVGQITLRHLFAHTTGLPNTDLALLFAGLPPEGFVEFLKNVPLNSRPGESRTYHNQAYSIGGYVAAMVAGGRYGDNLLETYLDLMQTRVFDPIGMSTATLSVEEAEASPNHATPHYITLNATLAQTGFDIAPTHYWDVGATAPAGGVRASAMDVGRFLRTMLAEGVAPDGTRVVSDENLAETWTQQIEINAEPFLEGAGYALGWNLADYQGVIAPTHYWDVGATAPAGGVRASAMDVGRFLRTMLAEGVAPDGTRVVSDENLAETWTQQIEINAEPFLEGAGYALGWNLADYQGVTVVTHQGGIGGFSASMAFVPDASTGIVILNNVDTLGSALGRNVQYRLVEMLFGLEPKVEEFAKAELEQIAGLSDLYAQLLPVDRESVAPYLGEYESVGNPYSIEWRDGGLWLSWGPLDIGQLLASPDEGYVGISPGELFFMLFQFEEDEDGGITLVIAEEIEARKLASFEVGPCLTTLAVPVPIEFVYVGTIPTAFDGINSASCSFTKAVETVTVTLSGPANHTETFTLTYAATNVSFPLPEGTLSITTQEIVPPGDYTREVTVTSVDGETLRITGQTGMLTTVTILSP